MSAYSKYDSFNFKRALKLNNNYVVYFQNSMTTCEHLNHFIDMNKICFYFPSPRIDITIENLITSYTFF